MKQIGSYNKIPDSLQVPPLKKGEYVLYRLLDPAIDPNDPLKQKYIWPRAKKIPTLDRIHDPKTGEPIDIGVVDRVNRDGVPSIKTYWVNGSESNGYFTLTGGRGYDDYFYEYFELTNTNKSNPHRDTSVFPLFERIDRVADEKKKLKKRDEELDALIYVRDMGEKELRLLAASMMWDDKDDIDALRNRAIDFAKADPRKFSTVVRSKDVEIKANLKKAQELEVIRYNTQQNKVVWGVSNDTIATLPRVEGQDWLTSMCDWIKTAKNGDKTYEAIRKQLDSKMQPA
jgi:hypothetical protein